MNGSGHRRVQRHESWNIRLLPVPFCDFIMARSMVELVPANPSGPWFDGCVAVAAMATKTSAVTPAAAAPGSFPASNIPWSSSRSSRIWGTTLLAHKPPVTALSSTTCTAVPLSPQSPQSGRLPRTGSRQSTVRLQVRTVCAMQRPAARTPTQVTLLSSACWSP
jgi:hypothetical protein